MNWSDVTGEHHNRRAKVWADSTPENPITGDPPVEGRIKCADIEDAVPALIVDGWIHTFSDWYQVEILP